MPENITLCTSKASNGNPTGCPFAHRAEIALAEAKAPFTRYEIDLQNKPEWYAPKINPASKVPAIAYGGPQSTKIVESIVLVEFIDDLFPESGILPKDPVKRAQARFFVEGVSRRFVPAWFAYQLGRAQPDDFYKAVEHLQTLLPEEGFAVGEYSIADIVLTPLVARGRVSLLNDIGFFPAGEGKTVWETVTTGKFARFGTYANDLLARESFKATFDEPYTVEAFTKRFAELREQQNRVERQ
ncbi:hypothetical protein C8Q74DRAFT_1318762 [Fomes fomentarius]|nr:hypothetical protein C8Q74DRAFT_1318762 [Fomes fomentarius]